MALLYGWGRETWSSGPWSQPAPLAVTGVEAAGALGSELIKLGVTIGVTGLESTNSIGTISIAVNSILTVSGVQGAGTIGTATASASSVTTVTGVEGAGSLGLGYGWGRGTWSSGPWSQSGIVKLGVTVGATGLEIANSIGTVSVVTNSILTATGVQGAGAIGSATVATVGIHTVTGVEAVGEIGDLGVGVSFAVTGVEAASFVVTPNVWSVVDTTQTANWVLIAA